MARLWDLPEEVITSIAVLLPPLDFLNLCSTCHLFQDSDDIRHSAQYWRGLVQETFRVPNLPVVASDGQRFHSLYRRMLQQTRIYFWGNDDGGAGGFNGDDQHIHWPQPINNLERISSLIIADLQCGGWSTSVLTSKGELYVNGTLGDGVHVPMGGMVRLGFGPSLDLTNNPQYRVKQFSQGRSSLLGLSDTASIWSWTSGYTAASGIRFAGCENAMVEKVVSGWDRDSAILKRQGLFIWKTISRAQMDRASISVLVDQFWVVPNVDSLVSTTDLGKPRSTDINHSHTVVNWILLSEWIVWLTRTGQLFASRLPADYESALSPFELTTDSDKCIANQGSSIIDLQGSHRSIGVFLLNGEVLVSNTDSLEAAESGTFNFSLRRIPSLQGTGVISLAFGDWHYHALHRDGSISSYGREPRFCGALGLSSMVARGVSSHHSPGALIPDGELLSQCYTSGRRVYFEAEKHSWLEAICRGDKGDSERVRVTRARNEILAEVSEWFEDRLKFWDSAPPVASSIAVERKECSNANDDGLPAYFPVNVVAGGWHSAALVLVNEGKAAQARKRFATRPVASQHEQTYGNGIFERALSFAVSMVDSFLAVQRPPAEIHDTGKLHFSDERFPRLRLRSGEIMPGGDDEPIDESWVAPDWVEVEDVTL